MTTVEFRNKDTGEIIPNEEIYDKVIPATWWDSVCIFGIGALSHSGGFDLTEEAFNAHAKRTALTPAQLGFMHGWLIMSYKFSAHRSL